MILVMTTIPLADAKARLSAVLGAMGDRQRQRVVLQLGERNQLLLDRLGLSPTKQSTIDCGAE